MQTNGGPVAIGVDIGTSGARAAAIDPSGKAIGFASAPFANAEEARQPQSWWHRVSECLTSLSKQIDISSVEGIAVDGTSGTVLSLDKDGEPLGDVLMYNDPCPDKDIVDRISATAPSSSPALGANSGLARAIHLSRSSGVSRVVHQADWILTKLGQAEPVADENNALKSGYDLSAETWPDWIEKAGMDRSMFPRVVRAGDVLGPVDGFSKRVGLSAECRFHAGTTDGCASFLATGASRIGDGVTALGSTIVLKLACDRPINAPEYGVYAHRVLDFWLVGGASNSGGAVIRALLGGDVLEDLTSRMRADEPTRFDYYPLLKPGERFPINDPAYLPRLTPRPTDDALFFQGLLEGMTEIERLGYSRLKELGGPTLRSVRTVGGGAKNPIWAKMRSAALSVPQSRAASVEAAVGTASLVLAARKRAQ
jgi:sugar (pentulose or hexulose) kinase